MGSSFCPHKSRVQLSTGLRRDQKANGLGITNGFAQQCPKQSGYLVSAADAAKVKHAQLLFQCIALGENLRLGNKALITPSSYNMKVFAAQEATYLALITVEDTVRIDFAF